MFGYFRAMARYADFEGRSDRAEFWSYTITAGVIVLVAQWAFLRWPTTVPYPSLLVLAHVIPTAVTQIRRLHDVGRTGWWLLIGLTGIGIIPLLVWFCQAGVRTTTRVEPAFAGEPSAPALDPDRHNYLYPEEKGGSGGTVVGVLALIVIGGGLAWAIMGSPQAMLEAGRGLLASWAAEGGEVQDVPGFLISHGIDHAGITTMGPQLRDASGVDLMMVARCLALTPPGFPSRKLGLVDLGNNELRFVMHVAGGELTLHARPLNPNLYLFDEINDGKQVYSATAEVDYVMLALIGLCVGTLQSKG